MKFLSQKEMTARKRRKYLRRWLHYRSNKKIYEGGRKNKLDSKPKKKLQRKRDCARRRRKKSIVKNKKN